jgi:hypothetical protein
MKDQGWGNLDIEWFDITWWNLQMTAVQEHFCAFEELPFLQYNSWRVETHIPIGRHYGDLLDTEAALADEEMPKTGSTKHQKTAANLSLCAEKKSKILEHSHINRFFVANFAICSKFSAETFTTYTHSTHSKHNTHSTQHKDTTQHNTTHSTTQHTMQHTHTHTIHNMQSKHMQHI